jgi:hypothetical protein
MKQRDLRDRLFNFAVRVIKFLRHLPKEPEASIIRYQLAKSSTSSGANYEESQAVDQGQIFRIKSEFHCVKRAKATIGLGLLIAHMILTMRLPQNLII